MSQASIFSVNIDDLEDCTCRMGTVFGGDYWDAPPTTSPEDCEAHRNDVLQRRPTRASLNFALDMERKRLAQVARADEDARQRKENGLRLGKLFAVATKTVPVGHDSLGMRAENRYLKSKYHNESHAELYERLPKCKCCVWPVHAVAPIAGSDK